MPPARPTVLTIAEIDRDLSVWQERLGQMDENILALNDDFTYKLISDHSPTAIALAGSTQKRATAAIEASRQMFLQRGLLGDVVERARQKRNAINRLWQSEQALREITDLLLGPSIVLDTSVVPLLQRQLLGSGIGQQRVSPAEVLQLITDAFELVRDTAAAIGNAWNQLTPAIDAAQTKLAAMETQWKAVDGSDAPELESLRQELSAIRLEIASDPLGVDAGISQRIEPRLRDFSTRLDCRVREQSQSLADLQQAQTQLTALERLHGECLEWCERFPIEIADPAARPTPLPDQRLTELRLWLKTLEETVGAKRWNAAQIGLTRILTTMAQLTAQEDGTRRAHREPIDLRDELRGRLPARRAQLAKLRLTGVAGEADLEDQAREIAALLRARPTPIRSVTLAFAALEERIEKLSRRG